jgi:hypothetical protein
MPSLEIPFPVGTTSIKIVGKDGEKNPITIGTDTFTRTGEDGAEIILPLFHGDTFEGEILDGMWHKGFDASIDTFTASIQSGNLALTGISDNPSVVNGRGWISCQNPMPLVDELQIEVSLEVPVDDTGSQEVNLDWFLRQDKADTTPDSDNNLLRFQHYVTNTGYKINIYQSINGASTLLASGSNYLMAGDTATGDLEGVVWRLVFNGKPGVIGSTVSVYLKQDDTMANAELATENEIVGSPFDTDGWAFDIAYPAYLIVTQDATYFGTAIESANAALSGRITVDYPDLTTEYGVPDANLHLGEVELYDGDPDSGGVRVYDEDHVFSNDPYLQNGLNRVKIDSDSSNASLTTSVWSGGAWVVATGTQYATQLRLIDDAQTLQYHHLTSVISIATEKVMLRVRMTNSAVLDNDYYADVNITLERGKWLSEVQFVKVSPLQDCYYRVGRKSPYRWGYAGDGYIGDSDLSITQGNATMSDNFMSFQDIDSNRHIVFLSINKEPSSQFYCYRGRRFEILNSLADDIVGTIFYIGAVDFEDIANTFEEAEDATLAGGATSVVDALASDGNAVLLNAQDERVYITPDVGTDLPAGRYLIVFRIRDTNQIADDVEIRIYNNADGEPRNQANGDFTITVTASYSYYSYVFDVTDTDVAGTDEFIFRVKKILADANDVYVDYFLIIPLGDGYSFPQTLAHNALRKGTIVRRVVKR